MGQTASQIENHIEGKRVDLGSNLRELEDKVKSVTDWHRQFEKRPVIFLGLAFGGGAVLASMVGRSGGGRRYYNYIPGNGSTGTGPETRTHRAPSPARASSPAMERASQAWENVKGALVGIAASKVKDYADGIIPGFSDHYRQTEAQQKHQA